ncbi:PHB depolymerase family esterase, partial [uncultured Rhodoblastus sp.]|uniref:extracellular catalytic domain type 1 short-chain-length polyhydroxyalkanoate depolymerase n=1 Tax=uncultured Rhodoblastus sp. TaxID=543037 RepID=UPI0025D7B573
MDGPKKTDMFEALRLTREGRLDEAMAALRRSLSHASPSEDAAARYDLPHPPPLRGRAGQPRLSIPGVLGGLVRSMVRSRAAHPFDESREAGPTNEVGGKAQDREKERNRVRTANEVTIDLTAVEPLEGRVATDIDKSFAERLDRTREEALGPAPLARVQPGAPVTVRRTVEEKHAEIPGKAPDRRSGRKLAEVKRPDVMREDIERERVSAPAVARGPARSRDQGRFEQRSFANASGARPYKLYVPSRLSGEPLPLLVMMHGCTQSPDDFAAGTRMNQIAEEEKFLVAYPAQTSSANLGKCWNWFNSRDQRRDQGEPSLIAGITREIVAHFPVDPERVYIAGLSAGGAAAANMGALYPDLYAAIGVHSGLACGAASDMPSAFAAMKKGAAAKKMRRGVGTVPAIVFHGDRDATVHPANGDGVVEQARGGANLRETVTSGVAAGGRKF